MKTLAPFLLIVFLLNACKDKVEIIEPIQNPLEVLPATFKQNVLIEHFTGEWCAPCVEGSRKIEDLRQKAPNTIWVASIHDKDFLEIPYGPILSNRLGGLVSIPRASINRQIGVKTYLGLDDNFMLLSSDNWDYMLNLAIKKQAPLSIALETFQIEKKGTINVSLAYKEPINADTRIGIYFIEDNIQSVFQQGANSNFLHQNVVMDVINYEGDTIALNENSEKGTIVKKSFDNIDLTKFNLNKLRIIAFVFKYDIDFRKMSILNVQGVKWGGNKYWD